MRLRTTLKLRAASRKFSPNATRSDVFSPNSRHTFLRAGPTLSYLGRMPKHIVEAFIRVLSLAKCGCPAEIDRCENFKHIDSLYSALVSMDLSLMEKGCTVL